MNEKLLLVRLPRVKGIDEKYYGIGYFSKEKEFIFSLITPEIIKTLPVRSIDKDKTDEIFVIGTIDDLP